MRSEENVATAEITWEELIQLLVERPDWLERVRQVVLTRELLALPETVQELAELQRQTALQVQELVEVQRRHEERLASVEDRLASVEDRLARLEAAVQELVEAQRRHEERLTSVEERLASVEDRLASAEDRLARLEATVQELVGALKEISYQVHELAQAVFRLTETVSRLEGTVGDIKGRLLEMAYRDKPYAYFGRLLRSIRVVPFTEIEDSLERSLSRDDVDDLLQLDLLLRGRLRDHPERPEVWLAVEVSSVVDKWDVERARERAALLRKAGFRAVPVAAGLQCLAEAAHKAEIEGVALVTDGSIAHWEQALRSTLD